MDLEEIRKHKQMLEVNIAKSVEAAINKFVTTTSVTPKDVYINLTELTSIGQGTSLLVDVKVCLEDI